MDRFSEGDYIEFIEGGGLDVIKAGTRAYVRKVVDSPLGNGSQDLHLSFANARLLVVNAESWRLKIRKIASAPAAVPQPRLLAEFPSQVLDIITDKLSVLRVCYPSYRDDQLLTYMLLSTGIVDKLCSYNHCCKLVDRVADDEFIGDCQQPTSSVVYEFTGARFCSPECMADWVAQQERIAQVEDSRRG